MAVPLALTDVGASTGFTAEGAAETAAGHAPNCRPGSTAVAAKISAAATPAPEGAAGSSAGEDAGCRCSLASAAAGWCATPGERATHAVEGAAVDGVALCVSAAGGAVPEGTTEAAFKASSLRLRCCSFHSSCRAPCTASWWHSRCCSMPCCTACGRLSNSCTRCRCSPETSCVTACCSAASTSSSHCQRMGTCCRAWSAGSTGGAPGGSAASEGFKTGE
mmetsp:Transcript_4661/g.13400  ORF Transcript_4661/g.13400 Transcript_4661/m.13400 type:complete len:220 (-) Transcript_4661:1411-2070(-)